VLDLAVKGNVPLQGWRTWEKTTMDSHNATPLVAVVILDGGNGGVSVMTEVHKRGDSAPRWRVRGDSAGRSLSLHASQVSMVQTRASLTRRSGECGVMNHAT
jgi:hypothetical protein